MRGFDTISLFTGFAVFQVFNGVFGCHCFRGYTYYKMGNLDNRIANADQLLTQDVEKFCNSVVDLYSNLSKVALNYPQNCWVFILVVLYTPFGCRFGSKHLPK